jgi:hypothetical protein
MNDVVLGAIILAPALVTFLLKSDAALGFLTLCAGFVLSTSAIGDLKRLLSETNLSVTESTLALILLCVPLGITLLVTRNSSGKKAKFWFHLATALCIGGFLALSLGPVLERSSQLDVTASQFWDELQNIQSIIIGAGSLLSLGIIWFSCLKPHKKRK